MIVNVCASSRNSRDVWYVPSNYFIPEERTKSASKEVPSSKKMPLEKKLKTQKKVAWIEKLMSKLIKKKRA